MGNNTDDVQIFISVDKIKNWVKALNKLNSLPGIKKITTRNLLMRVHLLQSQLKVA